MSGAVVGEEGAPGKEFSRNHNSQGCHAEPTWGGDTGEGASALRYRQVKGGARDEGREAPGHPEPLLG